MGVISALGVGTDATLRCLLHKQTGIGTIAHLPTERTEFPSGEVALSNAQLASMLDASYPVSELRTALLGICAAREAVQSAELTADMLAETALISGTTVGGMDYTERHFHGALMPTADAYHCGEMKYNDCGYSTEMIADSVGAGGMITTTSTACSSAANAIILGANLIKSGMADVVIAGGAEALSKFHLNGFNTLMILDREHCQPFDRDRRGINLGEGAAFLVLESEAHARARKAALIAELSGYANTCDAFHQTASSENGEGAFRSMSAALDMAGLKPADIDYVNSHGTGTPNNDVTELAAMRRLWPEALPAFSSTKSYTGHTTSASGSIESIIAILAMRHDFLPPNLGWQAAIEDGAEPVADLRSHRISHVLNNSFGFGGNDSTLIFSASEDTYSPTLQGAKETITE